MSVAGNEVAEAFAQFFEKKVKNIVDSSQIDENVYNGRQKMVTTGGDFMTTTDILECVNQLKMKNCEGYDRIPQRILIDGISILINPLSNLFNLIYKDCQIPQQWLIAKITSTCYFERLFHSLL